MSNTAKPQGYRVVTVINAGRNVAVADAQAAWVTADPIERIAREAGLRYTRGISLDTDVAAFRQRGHIGAAHLWVADREEALALAHRLQQPGLLHAFAELGEAKVTVVPIGEFTLIGDHTETADRAIKAVFLVKGKPGMAPADFHDYWLNIHGPMVIGQDGVTRYMQGHRLLDPDNDEDAAFDGVTEMTYPDMAGYEAFSVCEPHRSIQTADLPNVFDLAVGVRFFTREEEVC